MGDVTKILLPREHGAYAELGFPLLSSLTVARPTVVSAAMAAAAILLFLAHEPFAVVSGVRGRRVRDQSGRQAWWAFAVLAGTGVSVGVTGLFLADHAVRLATLVPLGLALALSPWVILHRQKSLPAEILVVGIFATLVLPLGRAGGMSWELAATVATVWFMSFIPGTITVHALKLHHKRHTGAAAMRTGGAGTALAVGGVAVAAAVTDVAPALAAVAVLPPAGAAMILSIRPVHPRNLKRVGWTLVGTSTLTWICLLAL
jgi:hypothetical protein